MCRWRLRPTGWLAGLGLALACEEPPIDALTRRASARQEPIDAPPLPPAPAPLAREALRPDPSVEPPATSAAVPRPRHEPASGDTPAPPPLPRLELRHAARPQMVHAEPSFDAPWRGRIEKGERFLVLERVPEADPRCDGEGWARVWSHGFVCLRPAEVTPGALRPLPALVDDELAPFYYARLPKAPSDATEDPPPVSMWRNHRALRRGDPPVGELERKHVYAFVGRLAEGRWRRDPLLVDAQGRVVREAEVRRLTPSGFEGRDLARAPRSPGVSPGWSVSWPHATVRRAPDPSAAEVGRLPLHTAVDVHPEPVRERGTTWMRITSPAGWVDAHELHHWVDLPPPAGVADDERWIDVDLEQQTLALRRGPLTEFVTLVSSGAPGTGTPLGIFRITTKQAYADMRSDTDDEDEYHVEKVPWVQYFRGDFALHGTFWHNRFGRRASHGCINLSATDAARMFEATRPAMPPGWSMVFEHPEEPGTTLRIRRGAEPPPDRREPVLLRGPR